MIYHFTIALCLLNELELDAINSSMAVVPVVVISSSVIFKHGYSCSFKHFWFELWESVS